MRKFFKDSRSIGEETTQFTASSSEIEVVTSLSPQLPHLARGVTAQAGTVTNDMLIGSSRVDNIRAFGGDDKILSGRGNDVVDSGAGSDTVFGGAGDDTLYGSDDDDVLNGENGADLLYGDNGNDKLDGGRDDDRLFGGSGNDSLIGGNGSDLLSGDAGDDVLDGAKGSTGSGAGNDTFIGGAGSDHIILANHIVGGAHIVDFAGTFVNGQSTGVDVVEGFQAQATGSSGTDRIDLTEVFQSLGYDFQNDYPFAGEHYRIEQLSNRDYDLYVDTDRDGAADTLIAHIQTRSGGLDASDFIINGRPGQGRPTPTQPGSDGGDDIGSSHEDGVDRLTYGNGAYGSYEDSLNSKNWDTEAGGVSVRYDFGRFLSADGSIMEDSRPTKIVNFQTEDDLTPYEAPWGLNVHDVIDLRAALGKLGFADTAEARAEGKAFDVVKQDGDGRYSIFLDIDHNGTFESLLASIQTRDGAALEAKHIVTTGDGEGPDWQGISNFQLVDSPAISVDQYAYNIEINPLAGQY